MAYTLTTAQFGYDYKEIIIMIMICDFLPKGASQVAALIAVAVLGILATIPTFSSR